MPRRNDRAKPPPRTRRRARPIVRLSPTVERLRPLYVRACSDCGHMTTSEDVRLYTMWLECPQCTGAV